MIDKFICDGCNHVFDRSELAETREVKLAGNGNYAGNIITLFYCRECWEKKKEEAK